jgi:hypothetical protein
MPVVHALLQAREDVGRLAERVPEAHVWQRPGGAASIGFHIRHTGGALDRLFTYARGEPLSGRRDVAGRIPMHGLGDGQLPRQLMRARVDRRAGDDADVVLRVTPRLQAV